MDPMTFILTIALTAQPSAPLVLPKEVAAPNRQITAIVCKVDSLKALDWKFSGPGLCFREHSDDPKLVRFQVVAHGTCYLAVAVVDKDGKLHLAECVITGTPGPGPDPGPKPPPEPGKMREKIKAAYDSSAEPASTKKAQLLLLIGGYSAFAEHAKDTKKMRTAGDLRADLAELGKVFLRDSLVGVRKLVAAELAGVVGTDESAVITDPQRQALVALLVAVVEALEWVGAQ